MARVGLRGLLLTAGWLVAANAAAVDIVAHPAVPESDIARPLLRGVFGMRVRAWADGTPVRVFVLGDDDPLHGEFARSMLQMYPWQLRHNWDRLLYSGTGQQPVTVGSEDELLRRVAETPGGIGYVNDYRPADSKNRSPPSPAVKVLHVR